LLCLASYSISELPGASLHLLTPTTKPPRACCSACNDEMIISTEWKEVWAIGKGSEFVVPQLPPASSSFLQLPEAPYSHHEAVAMGAIRKLIILTEWKEVWTIGKGSELLRCCFPQLPAASCYSLQLPPATTKPLQCVQRGKQSFPPTGTKFGRLERSWA
jgi:hypothetical protein